ncbi:MAG: hypothetical protein ABII00_10480 [Elusimicrobiota bacterium]
MVYLYDMRYWLYRDDKVTGPFDRESLRRCEGFSEESLVCPERYRIGGPGDWLRAAVVPELRELLPPSFHQTMPGGALKPVWLPPEPTLHDAASLRSMQERIIELEAFLRGNIRTLRSRENRYQRMSEELSLKERAISALRARIVAAEDRLRAISDLREALRRTHEKIASQERAVAGFGKRLGRMSRRARKDMGKAGRAAAELVEKVREVLEEAKKAVEDARKTAEEAVRTAAEAAEAKAPEPPAQPPPPPPKDLGLPEATIIDETELGF